MKLALMPGTLRIAHHEHVADGINNGHTIQINYEGADTLVIGGDSYDLVQYHFHNQSEHSVAGKRFPMEMHMVHKSDAGKLAVVGVFIEEGAHNAAFDPIWNNLPTQKGVETHYRPCDGGRRQTVACEAVVLSVRWFAHHAAVLGRSTLDRDDDADSAVSRSDPRVYSRDSRQQSTDAAVERAQGAGRGRDTDIRTNGSGIDSAT